MATVYLQEYVWPNWPTFVPPERGYALEITDTWREVKCQRKHLCLTAQADGDFWLKIGVSGTPSLNVAHHGPIGHEKRPNKKVFVKRHA